MIKIKDVVVDYQRRILQVEGFQKDGAETFVLGKNLSFARSCCRSSFFSKKTSILCIKKLAKLNLLPYSLIMNKEQELKELIEIHTPIADAGVASAKILVINAQIELDEIQEIRQNQMTLTLTD